MMIWPSPCRCNTARTYITTHGFSPQNDVRQLDDLQRELEDLRLENRIFKSYYERHASEIAAEVDDDKRKTNRQRRRQLPTVLTIEQKVEIGAHEQEVAHKDVSIVNQRAGTTCTCT